MAEPVKASTICLVIGIGLLIVGVFIQGRPEYWVVADMGAGIMIISAVILLIIGGLLRWGRMYAPK
jgi:membrane protein YdbS with pleckstrin-like domain